MLKIYGIKTCNSVRKALAFFKENNIPFDFIDFKKEKCNKNIIKNWVKQAGLDVVLNKKGATYRTLDLKSLQLSDETLIDKMEEFNLLIKRPVVEYKEEILIGFDEVKYKTKFLKG